MLSQTLRLARGSAAGDQRAQARLVDQHARLIRAGTRNSSQRPDIEERPRPRDRGMHGGEAFRVSPRVCLGRDACDLERLD
jgi:hypothetical protein